MEALAAPAFGASAEAGGTSGAGKEYGPGATTAKGGELAPITALILVGARHQIEEALKLCEQLDTPPRQIFISATITEVSRDKVTSLGIDWTGLAGTQVKWGESPAVAKGVAGNEREIELGKWVRSPLVIESVLEALVTDNKAKILAKPNVALLDGRQATIHAGNTIYYLQTVGYSPLSGAPITQVGQIRVGVILMVTGRLSPDGSVTLTLVPTVSAVVGWVNGLPNINERSTVTTVRVKAGESVVLGGLVQEDETIVVTEVPFLSKVPVVGEFFRHTRKNPVHRELLIVITPTIKES
jgi:type II secretory pathway component GspD/PulD (secretin)